MIGPVSNSLMHLLRILTPYEINRLTQEVESKRKHDEELSLSTSIDLDIGKKELQTNISMQDMGLLDLTKGQSQAKILPFDNPELKEEKKEQKEKQIQKQLRAEEENSFLDVLKIHPKKSKAKIRKKIANSDYYYEDEELPSEAEEDQVSTSIFLLEQREKIRKSNSRLSGKEAVNVYKKQASVDVKNESKDDLSESSATGILVNKRQF